MKKYILWLSLLSIFFLVLGLSIFIGRLPPGYLAGFKMVMTQEENGSILAEYLRNEDLISSVGLIGSKDCIAFSYDDDRALKCLEDPPSELVKGMSFSAAMFRGPSMAFVPFGSRLSDEKTLFISLIYPYIMDESELPCAERPVLSGNAGSCLIHLRGNWYMHYFWLIKPDPSDVFDQMDSVD